MIGPADAERGTLLHLRISSNTKDTYAEPLPREGVHDLSGVFIWGTFYRLCFWFVRRHLNVTHGNGVAPAFGRLPFGNACRRSTDLVWSRVWLDCRSFELQQRMLSTCKVRGGRSKL